MMDKEAWQSTLVGLGVFFVIGNLLVLDFFVLRNVDTKQQPAQPATLPQVVTVNQPSPSPQQICPNSCLAAITEATASTKTITTTTVAPTIAAALAKEFFITIGTSAYASVSDWSDVPGVKLSLDRSNFANIKSVSFEATVHTPNVNEDVSVRLYSETAKHPVWSSELFFPSGTSTNYLASPPIALDQGNNIYTVQMKTQYNTPANLDQSRLHIILN